MRAGSFSRVSVIHRTLTWTTGSLTCVRDHSCACVYTRGLGTPVTSQYNIIIIMMLMLMMIIIIVIDNYCYYYYNNYYIIIIIIISIIIIN